MAVSCSVAVKNGGMFGFPEKYAVMKYADATLLNVKEASVSVNQIESSRIFGYGEFRRGEHLRYLDWPDGELTLHIWWGESEYP